MRALTSWASRPISRTIRRRAQGLSDCARLPGSTLEAGGASNSQPTADGEPSGDRGLFGVTGQIGVQGWPKAEEEVLHRVKHQRSENVQCQVIACCAVPWRGGRVGARARARVRKAELRPERKALRECEVVTDTGANGERGRVCTARALVVETDEAANRHVVGDEVVDRGAQCQTRSRAVDTASRGAGDRQPCVARDGQLTAIPKHSRG